MLDMSSSRQATPQDLIHLRTALEVGTKSQNASYYGVGAIIVDRHGSLISSGFTGEKVPGFLERESSLHAEEAAILKAQQLGRSILSATMYSTMEPCSRRKSGREACSNIIIRSGLSRVVFGAHEPYHPDLDIVCEGKKLLLDAGLTVLNVKELEEECLKAVLANRKGDTAR